MKHRVGNVLDGVKQGIILQQVNAQGVMGSGIAKEIRSRWPKVWDIYSNTVTPGQYQHSLGFMGWIIPVEVESGLFIVNMVGQQFYGKADRRYTSYDALDDCLSQVAKLNEVDQLPVHHPALGAGLGGGHWPVIAAIIEHRLGPDTTLWTLE